MFDVESRHMIEALRSGIPSRAVGQYFSESRGRMLEELARRMDNAVDRGQSSGMIFTGKYGEGKTHLLNTAFNMAHERNMVVSMVSLSKETPIDKLYMLYQKIIANTYLPGRQHPGVMQELDRITANTQIGSDLLLFAAAQLKTNKLFYLLKSYFRTEDADEHYMLQADLEGDFLGNGPLKKIYRRIFNETAQYNVPFSKTKHAEDYFYLMSYFFRLLGYGGWVILVDETELMGRLGKKARLNGYRCIANFLMPDTLLKSTFTMFALSASYAEDVIESRSEYENLEQLFPEDQEPMRSVLDAMQAAPQLTPLTKEELRTVFERMIDFHGRAYDWTPSCTVAELMKASQAGGYLLRTRIRFAIEYLDQLYQYGDAGLTEVKSLTEERLEEEPVSLENLEDRPE